MVRISNVVGSKLTVAVYGPSRSRSVYALRLVIVTYDMASNS